MTASPDTSHWTVVGGHKPKDLPEFHWINAGLGNLKTSLSPAPLSQGRIDLHCENRNMDGINMTIRHCGACLPVPHCQGSPLVKNLASPTAAGCVHHDLARQFCMIADSASSRLQGLRDDHNEEDIPRPSASSVLAVLQWTMVPAVDDPTQGFPELLPVGVCVVSGGVDSDALAARSWVQGKTQGDG